MVLSSTLTKNEYDGPTSTNVFPYQFKIFFASDLQVVWLDADEVEHILTRDVDYTVSGAGDDVGGNVTRTAGNLLVNERLVIRSLAPELQLIDLINQGAFYAEIHEFEFDYLTRLIQQNSEEIGRCLQGAITGGTVVTLPLPEQDNALVWDNDDLVNRPPSWFSSMAAAGNIIVDNYTSPGDFTPGVTTSLVVTQDPGTVNNLWIFFDGTYLEKDNYTLNVFDQTQIDFNVAIPGGVSEVEIVQTEIVDIGTPANGSCTYSKIGQEAVKEIKLGNVVESATTTAPPGSPSTGDRYIVPVGATGAWAGNDTKHVEFDGVSWRFTNVWDGMYSYVKDADSIYTFDGSAWQPFTVADGAITTVKLAAKAVTEDKTKLYVLNRTVSDPSTLTPVVGDRHIVNPTGVGAWAGKNNNIAECTSLGPVVWSFIAPHDGMITAVIDEYLVVMYDLASTSWKTKWDDEVSADNFMFGPGGTNWNPGTGNKQGNTWDYDSVDIDPAVTITYVDGWSVIRVQGDCEIDGTLRLEGMAGPASIVGNGPAGAQSYANGGGGGDGGNGFAVDSEGGGGGGGLSGGGGAGGGPGSSNSGGAAAHDWNAILNEGGYDYDHWMFAAHLLVGGLGGSGGAGTGDSSPDLAGGDGGDGGGNVVLLVKGDLFGTGTIDCSGQVGGAAGQYGGTGRQSGGGGGGGGLIWILCDGDIDDVTLDVRGGAGGAWNGNSHSGSGGGGGGGLIVCKATGAITNVTYQTAGGAGGTNGAGSAPVAGTNGASLAEANIDVRGSWI